MLNDAGSSVALIPASRPHIPESENVQRANDLASFAKVNGLGVFVLEGRGLGTAQELLVLVVGNEPQVVGFARRVIREADAATNWFLFERPGGDLMKENADGSREKCAFERDGFTLPDGDEFKLGTAYSSAQFNEAWGHSLAG
jgi:hypothetical protein